MREKRVLASIATGVALIASASLILFFAFSSRFEYLRGEIFHRPDMGRPIIEVTYFYVGQADAVLLRDLSGSGKVMLIDTGPDAATDEFSSLIPVEGSTRAATVIAPYLNEKGIEKIDYLVLTHKHGDHIGGAPYILQNFKVGAVYDNGTDYPSPLAEKYLKAVRESGADFNVARPGKVLPFGDSTTVQFIGPLRDYSGTLYSDENSNSIVTRVAAGNVTFMFAGDMEIPSELDLLSYGEDLRTTVMMAPHHGSHSSSSKPFLDYIKPEVAVFSAGRKNRYGLPSFEVIRRYQDRGARVYRTDLNGNITIISDGENYNVRTSR